MKLKIFFTVFVFFIFLVYIKSQENEEKILWSFDFSAQNAAKKFSKEWSVETKFMTRSAVFKVIKDETSKSVLRMEADRATASVVCNPNNFKASDAPIVRWIWRVQTLPSGADGRDSSKDDQAIGVYIGSGSTFSKKSISYRWDTETPVGSEGNCSYGAGTIKVKWYTLRNKNDKMNEWIIEERNWLDDYKKTWGEVPDTIYLSISCNSQYTRSKASAELLKVEFLSR